MVQESRSGKASATFQFASDQPAYWHYTNRSQVAGLDLSNQSQWHRTPCAIFMQHIPKTGTGFTNSVLEYFCPQAYQDLSVRDANNRNIQMMRGDIAKHCPWLDLMPNENAHAATPKVVHATTLDDQCCSDYQPIMFTMLRNLIKRLRSAFTYGYQMTGAPHFLST